jgi:hypothetical protein
MPHLIGHLSPVVHPKRWELIRVPVRKVGDSYIVYVADGYHRIYDDDTLPDVLKTKFAMILANASNKFILDDKVLRIALYTNVDSPELDEIGWRASETYFCLVLDRLTLESLKGGTQNDARRQSQSKD